MIASIVEEIEVHDNQPAKSNNIKKQKRQLVDIKR
jgi:hypothetical protein